MTRSKLLAGTILASAVLAFHSNVRANLIFNFIPEPGTPQIVIDGFQSAANRWSAVIADSITINVQIGFSSLGQFVVAQTGSDFREYSYTDTRAALAAHRTSADDYSTFAALPTTDSYQRLINHTSNSPHGPNSATPYLQSMDRVGITTANAKALGLLGPTSSLDAILRFNSDLAFDFNPDDGIASGYYDFIGVATHELGHALGFISGVDDLDQLGGVLPDNAFSSNLIDLFRFSEVSFSLGAGVTDYTADARLKYFSLNGGATALTYFSNGMIFGGGNQASHWKDFLGAGLMDPTVALGELMQLTETDLRAFDVLGYTLVPEPTSGALLLVSGLILWRYRFPQPKRSVSGQ